MSSVLRVALCGTVSLIVAMGIGRFALTPQLPVMLAEGRVTLQDAAWIAAANYLGYLVGALDALATRRGGAVKLKTGLIATVALTALSAIDGGWLWHAALRFVLGIASAWVLVMVSAWTAAELAKAGRPVLSLAVFAGTGIGIAISGLAGLALKTAGVSAAAGWCAYASLAALLVGGAWSALPARRESGAPPRPASMPRESAFRRILAAYSLAGFGYIIPATFLSHMAAERLPHGIAASLVWPVFGIAATLGLGLCALSVRLGSAAHRLSVLLLLQGAGVASSCLFSGISGLVLEALLTGGGFMGVVALAIEAGRASAPEEAGRVPALLTSGYAAGQLAGPVAAAVSVRALGGLDGALWLSCLALFFAARLAWSAAPRGVRFPASRSAAMPARRP
ncbi:YbfB/YjiJ family MFS transporter [Paludibacterium paludis]|uniref:MFS transporter n=1 Tax=Paludibacterium paludis TaxID=1225769 RepID=A0A918U6H1_9NEIS|nr:YbfB/YjiJ family MFS transporter [Paludibacterium paludis]GGY02922.1 MFS transporter [Paludibacterium paludis]